MVCERQTERSEGGSEHPCQLHPIVRTRRPSTSFLSRSLTMEETAHGFGKAARYGDEGQPSHKEHCAGGCHNAIQ